MSLHIHNTAAREKQAFTPLEEGKAGLYVCGPTVWDYAHIGNARPVVVFDILYRLMKLDYDVTYVRNFTDVDDKINARARTSGVPISEITEKTIAAYHEDMDALNALRPDVEPRATDHIQEMIDMIVTLIEKGHAYEVEGHVLFQVSSMEDYGKFSGRSQDEMIAGARVEVAPYKKDAADFVLWKPSEDDLPGWDSPWGRGRPGWHIECSAMSKKHLGVTFDIHGGGADLIFPHHQNEIAQSKCSHDGAEFARYWMHNGFLMVNGEKMSKSLGNFRTVHELLETHPGEAIRLALMSAHYRKPLDFSDDLLSKCKADLDRFYRAKQALEGKDITPRLGAAVRAALDDDLNTPLALSEMHRLAGEISKNPDNADAAAEFLAAADQLGLLTQDSDAWFKWAPAGDTGDLDDAAIDGLIEERAQAKKDKNFARADEIRDQLKDANIILEDGAGGTTWRRG